MNNSRCFFCWLQCLCDWGRPAILNTSQALTEVLHWPGRLYNYTAQFTGPADHWWAFRKQSDTQRNIVLLMNSAQIPCLLSASQISHQEQMLEWGYWLSISPEMLDATRLWASSSFHPLCSTEIKCVCVCPSFTCKVLEFWKFQIGF